MGPVTKEEIRKWRERAIFKGESLFEHMIKKHRYEERTKTHYEPDRVDPLDYNVAHMMDNIIAHCQQLAEYEDDEWAFICVSYDEGSSYMIVWAGYGTNMEVAFPRLYQDDDYEKTTPFEIHISIPDDIIMIHTHPEKMAKGYKDPETIGTPSRADILSHYAYTRFVVSAKQVHKLLPMEGGVRRSR